MLNRNIRFLLLPGLLILWSSVVNAQDNQQEFMTLFTTQQERSLIDDNRYRQAEARTARISADQQLSEQKQPTTYLQYNVSFELSGITLSEDGNHLAWINGSRVKNGDEIDEGVKVFISPKLKTLVQVKTPDGVYHNLEAGKKIEITYLKQEEG